MPTGVTRTTATGRTSASARTTGGGTTTPSDTRAPVVALIAESPTDTACTITATVDEASTIVVRYGTSPGSHPTATAPVLVAAGSFDVPLSDLASSTTHYYVIEATDRAGNVGTIPEDSFATAAAPGALSAMSLGAAASLATFVNLSLEIPFTGDDNGDATTTLQYRKTGAPTWLDGLPLLRLSEGTDRALKGSILLCDAGQQYDYRVVVTDPGAGSQVVTGTATTRAESEIPAAASLTPTRYIDSANGLDTNAGTSYGAAWRTFNKSNASTPSGGVVQVNHGYYAQALTVRTQALGPITYVAEHPACDDQAADKTVAILNDGLRSVVHSQVVAAPTGEPATDPHGVYASANVAPWAQVTVTGTNGVDYTVWKWTGIAGITIGSQLAYCATRDGRRKRVPVWLRDTYAGTPNLSTAAGWAHLCHTNVNYRYGAFLVTEGGSNNLYLRFAGTGTPNDYWWDFCNANKWAFLIYAGSSRISGLQITTADFGIQFGDTASGNHPELTIDTVVDHCWIDVAHSGVRWAGFSGTQGTSVGKYPSKATVEHCKFTDSNLRATAADNWVQTNEHIPWWIIKGYVRRGDNGQWYPSSTSPAPLAGVMTTCQSVAITFRFGIRQATWRYNHIDGFFNGPGGGGGEGGSDRTCSDSVDCHDNLMENLNDDSFEPEQRKANWRGWNNVTKDCPVFFSCVPVFWGPIYLFQNVMWRSGNHGSANFADPAAEASAPASTPARIVGPSPLFCKSGGATAGKAVATMYWINNTYWTDRDGSGTPQMGYQGAAGYDFGGAAGSTNYTNVIRNNIIRCCGYAWHAGKGDYAIRHDEDYNVLATSHATRVVGVDNGVIYTSTSPTGPLSLETYRAFFAAAAGRPAGFGNGVHTNRIGASGADVSFRDVAAADALFTDPTAGDLTLKAGTNPARNGGVAVANIHEGLGHVPSLGYIP